VREDATPPAPGTIIDNIGLVGDQRSVVCVELACLIRRTSPLSAWTHESRVLSVVCVELACLVRRTVVVRVTDR